MGRNSTNSRDRLAGAEKRKKKKKLKAILSTHAHPGQPVISVGCFLRMRAKEEILKRALKEVAK